MSVAARTQVYACHSTRVAVGLPGMIDTASGSLTKRSSNNGSAFKFTTVAKTSRRPQGLAARRRLIERLASASAAESAPSA